MMKKPAVMGVCAASIAGIALWVSRASFDVAGTTASPERVAMLPSLAELMGFIVMALLIAAGIASLQRSRHHVPAFWGAATDTLLPLFALLLLLLPYLPWVADWIPALRLLAGPGRFVIWVVVIGQVLWILLPQFSPSTAGAIFGIASVALSAPFVLNVSSFPTAFVDLFRTVQHLPSTNWSSVPTGILGVLFDQEYGIFLVAPVLLLGFIGLAGMLRERSDRNLGTSLGLAFLLLVVLPGTLDPWWSKSAMPGEQLMLLLPLLAMPIAWLYTRLPRESLSRAGAQVLLLFSVAVTLAFVLALVPVRQEADGSSGLLQWMSATWPLWSEAPSYVAPGVAGVATARVLVWLAVFAVLAWLFSRRRASTAGRTSLTATTSVTLVVVALLSTTSVTMSESTRRFDVERRAVFLLLETFDPIARPIAVRYDPFSLVSARELPSLFVASAVPGERTDPQPVRVVLNARFRLPTGKYVLDLTGSDEAGTVPNASIAFQVGREGRPLETWPLVLRRGQRTRHEFDVPLDAEFVGFRAARPVERTIAELRLSPLDVVETRKRFPAGTVLSAAVFAPARVFFHDSDAYPEADGIWVKGRTTARMTLLKVRENDPAMLLAVHGGARPNVVTLTTARWSQRLELVPGVTERVAVPSKEGERFVPLTISSTDGFVPAEIEQSRDRRLLGAWIAFIPDDIARTSAAP